jgi:hypothetical protein
MSARLNIREPGEHFIGAPIYNYNNDQNPCTASPAGTNHGGDYYFTRSDDRLANTFMTQLASWSVTHQYFVDS